MYCEKCGFDNQENSLFCENCGSSLPISGAGAEIKLQGKHRNKKKTIIALALSGVIVIAAAIVVFLLFFSGSKEEEATFYIKDRGLFKKELGSDDKPLEITDKILSKSTKPSYGITSNITMSADKKMIYYPERISDEDEAFSLYCRSLTDKETSPVKIDSNVTQYSITGDGQKVLYKKGDALYQYDLLTQDSNKIANSVCGFYCSEDESRILYFTDDHKAWFYDQDNGKTKLATGIEGVVNEIDDCNALLYVKDDSLFKVTVSEEDELITSGIDEVFIVYSTGDLYYTQKPEQDKKLTELFSDDLSEKDKSDLSSYDRALLDSFRDVYIPSFERSLYYYDSKIGKSELITDNYVAGTGKFTSQSAVAVFGGYDAERVKLSEFYKKYSELKQNGDLSDKEYGKLWITLFKSAISDYIAVGEKMYPIEDDGISQYILDIEGNSVALVKNHAEGSDDEESDIYLVQIDNGVPKKPELFETDVYSGHISFSKFGDVCYYKNYDEENRTAELYIGKNRIDEIPVRLDYDKQIIDSTPSVVYYSDWESEESCGTLKLFRNGKSVKLKGYVNDFRVDKSGGVVCISNYDNSSFSGDLYYFDNDEFNLIDDDVSAIVSVESFRYRGYSDSRMYNYTSKGYYGKTFLDGENDIKNHLIESLGSVYENAYDFNYLWDDSTFDDYYGDEYTDYFDVSSTTNNDNESAIIRAPQADEKKVINLWSFTDEIPKMVERYKELNPSFDYEIKTTIIATTDGAYQPALDAALAAGGDDAPDIYAAEAAFILKYSQGDAAGYAATYKDLGIDVDRMIADANIADYSVEIGTRPNDNNVVALGYQATGGCFIYRRSIAKDTWGTDDPTFVQDKIGGGSGSWDKFFAAAEELKAKGYAICSGDGDIWHAIENSADKGWIVDGKLYIDPKREAFLDLSKKLKDNGYHHDTQDWREGWFADMKKNGGVLGFFGPAWLINYTLAANCGEGYESSFGDWAVCNSPIGFFWGGTWVLANKDTKAKNGVAELIKWITLDCSTTGLQYYWANGTLNGEGGTKDTVASETAMRKSDGRLDFLGGQNMFDYYVSANKYANGKNLTQYDESINSLWRDAVRYYSGGYITKKEAIELFKQWVRDYIGID